jgi:hypothetical protein
MALVFNRALRRACRKATITASSSSIVSTAEEGVFGPVGTSATDVRFFHFETVF